MLKGGERMIQYPNTADLMIRNITVYTQDADRTVLPSVDVAIRGDTIAAIGHLPKKEWTAKQELDGTGKTLFPGMHNMHVHVFQSLLKDLGADKDLVGWLQEDNAVFGIQMFFHGGQSRFCQSLFYTDSGQNTEALGLDINLSFLTFL